MAAVFFLLLPPISSVSRSSIETALDSPAPLLSCAQSLRTGAASAPSGCHFTPRVHLAPGGQTGVGGAEGRD